MDNMQNQKPENQKPNNQNHEAPKLKPKPVNIHMSRIIGHLPPGMDRTDLYLG